MVADIFTVLVVVDLTTELWGMHLLTRQLYPLYTFPGVPLGRERGSRLVIVDAGSH